MYPVFAPNGFKGRNGGFLLLMVIISLAIGLLVLGASMVSMDPFSAFNGSGADRYCDPNAMPWEEDHLYINEALDAYHMGGRREPFRVQPKIEDTIYYEVPVYRDARPHGTVKVRISSDGDVKIGWQGKYTLNGIEYEIVAEDMGMGVTNSFKGNIAPLKVYKEEDIKDYKKLYFLSQGYALAVGQDGNRFEGTAYAAGWINKDLTCFGKLWIFGGGESAAVYEWKPAEPIEK